MHELLTASIAILLIKLLFIDYFKIFVLLLENVY